MFGGGGGGIFGGGAQPQQGGGLFGGGGQPQQGGGLFGGGGQQQQQQGAFGGGGGGLFGGQQKPAGGGLFGGGQQQPQQGGGLFGGAQQQQQQPQQGGGIFCLSIVFSSLFWISLKIINCLLRIHLRTVHSWTFLDSVFHRVFPLIRSLAAANAGAAGGCRVPGSPASTRMRRSRAAVSWAATNPAAAAAAGTASLAAPRPRELLVFSIGIHETYYRDQ